ncbi:MAG: endolytic transglycosylase MltG [Bdellovibrionales bacterium]|nr:endolytic transglycosylase MltG [Bdellovibrionales bacterium]
MKKLFAMGLALAFGGLGLCTYLFFWAPSPKEQTVVVIEPSSLKAIQSLLRREGVLEHPFAFEMLARISGKSKKVQSGEYLFDRPSSPWQVLQTLSHGKVLLHKVTIPEGYTLADIGKLLSDEGLVTIDRFQDLVRNSDWIKSLNIDATSLEGYLFPDTYHFSKSESEKQILQSMVKHMNQAIKSLGPVPLSEYGWSRHDWITFASIIEKESSVLEEQPLISSVFHNRLKKGMRLQSDPTVIYGIKNYDGNIRKKDLLTPTPYNTYTQKGLPPGPIASPGLSSLKAAVYPKESAYLYFVANRAGRHIFSENYEDHLKAVATYQLGK